MTDEKKITGYRELGADEIRMINEIKSHGQELEAMILRLDSHCDGNPSSERCIQLGVDHLQTGLMWLTRAVAKPVGF